ncbi:hypothetical protein Hanom_Chr04g00322851 [Helianthus anomalus]
MGHMTERKKVTRAIRQGEKRSHGPYNKAKKDHRCRMGLLVVTSVISLSVKTS